MTKKVNMSDLPAFLESAVAEYGLNQFSGYSIAKTPKTEVARKMCGMCFGAHLADFFKTPLKKISLTRLDDDVESELLQRGFGVAKVRDYVDGYMVLFGRLRKQPHFKKWFESFKDMHYAGDEYKNLLGRRLTKPDNEIVLSVEEVLADYLCEECGAPPSCFGTYPWPKSIKPQRVVRKMFKLNPGLVA